MEPIIIFLLILLFLVVLAVIYTRSSHQASHDKSKEERDQINRRTLDALQIYLTRNRLPLYPGPVPLMLKQDEHAIACSDARYAEERSIGNYSGMSFRVTKGMSYRTGQSIGSTEVRVIDQGKLILTTKRLVFVGDKRTSVTELQKIVNIEPYSDAIIVHKEGKGKAETYFFDTPAVYKLIIDTLSKFTFVKEDNSTLVMNSTKNSV
jgi:hypothetical protein